jgi:ABC-type multidrug transport system ATPase subunit
MSTISLADRIALVEGGRVVAQGTHAELLAGEPRYQEVLAQTEEDARRRADERETARSVFEERDRRALGDAVDADVERNRDLDADLGELADLDPELSRHGGSR